MRVSNACKRKVWVGLMIRTLLNSVAVLLRVTEGLEVDLVSLFNLASGSVTDEDGLSSPLLFH